MSQAEIDRDEVGAELRFRDLLDVFPAAVYTTDAAGRVTFFNRAAEELAGRTPIIGKDEWCVSWRLYTGDGEPLPLEQCPMAAALKGGRAVRNVEVIAERPDGVRVPLMPFPTPLRDASGRLTGAVNMLVDITELKRAQAAAAKRADEQGALYRFTDRLYRAKSADGVFEAALDAIVQALRCSRASILLFDDQGVMRFVAARGLSERYRQAVEGHSPWRPGDSEPAPIWIDDVACSSLDAGLQQTVLSEGVHSLAFIPINVHGAVIGKFMAYHDIAHPFTADEIDLALTIARQLGFAVERERTRDDRRRQDEARRRSEEQRVLLINELNHRVKNTLATVQSLAHQTLRSTERSEDARVLFGSRLSALAAAHDLLTITNWESADLRDVAERALAPFSVEEGRVFTAGGSIALSPKQVLALSIALHELATNAAKYGALSNATGRVDLEWRCDGDAFTLVWTETGGPAVVKPTRIGFGTRLIERSLTHDFGGAAKLEYRPEGVVVTIAGQLGLERNGSPDRT